MAKQFGNCWLSRDKSALNSYNISKARPVFDDCDDQTLKIWDAPAIIEMDFQLFHKLSSVRLKPGEGPMRAEFKLTI